MERAAAARDAAAIVRPAHTLKSSSAALGALRLAQIAREIEMSGRDGNADGLEGAVAQARDTWHATRSALTAAGLGS
jgi:HPt (histidine-containing phosphotransfer) domain-containing protein